MRLVVDLNAVERYVIEITPEERTLLGKWTVTAGNPKPPPPVFTKLISEAYQLSQVKFWGERAVPDWSRKPFIYDRIFGIALRTVD